MSKGISETAFASQVEDLLKLFGWRWCHFRPALTGAGWRTAMTGNKGMLDYICARPPRLIFAELKDEVKDMTDDQKAWFDVLMDCQRTLVGQPLTVDGKTRQATLDMTCAIPVLLTPEVYLWRPSQFDEVKRILE